MQEIFKPPKKQWWNKSRRLFNKKIFFKRTVFTIYYVSVTLLHCPLCQQNATYQQKFFHKIGIIHQLKRNKYSLLKYTTKYHEIHTTYIISLTSYIWCGYNMVPYEPGELICCSVTRLQWVFNTGWCLYTDCLSCM